MGIASKLGGRFARFGRYFVEGRGIRCTMRDLWRFAWKYIDRELGVFARWILKKNTKVDAGKVFFHTQENRYGCNPKYICEALHAKYPGIRIVWRISDKDSGGVPEEFTRVVNGTYDYFREILTSKVVVTNSVLYVEQPVVLRPEQKLIETWHGSLGIKRFGKNDYKNSRNWVKGAVKTGKMTSFCVTNGSFVTGSLRSTYWENTPVLEYGHPRNDLFFEPAREKRERLRRELCAKWGVPEETKFVMYGPTFRDNKRFDVYNVDFQRLRAALQARFGGEWMVLLRFHPSLVKVYEARQGSAAAGQGVIQVTDYTDMQELIAVTDVAVTDYSSWIYDFMLLRRPGFIYAPDIAEYNNERGFCYPLETTPFPIAEDNAALEGNVLSFDSDAYMLRLEEFLKDKGCIEDGHAAERTADKIAQLLRET